MVEEAMSMNGAVTLAAVFGVISIVIFALAKGAKVKVEPIEKPDGSRIPGHQTNLGMFFTILIVAAIFALLLAFSK